MTRTFSFSLALLALTLPSLAQYRGIEYEIADHHPIIDSVPRAVVRVYVGYDDPNDQLNAVYGNATHALSLSTTDPSGFYQHPAGGDTSLSINPLVFPVIPELEYDSWVTIGAEDNTGNNQLLNIGIDWAPWNSGGALETGDGTWFCIPNIPQVYPDASGRVLIAQLSVTYGETITGVFQLQGKDAAGNTTTHLDQYLFVPTGAGGAEYCGGNGDGGLSCPCANSSTSGGCANSTGQGAHLIGEGSSSVAANNLTLFATGLAPSKPGLYFQGNNRVVNGAGVHFGDGLRCAGGGVIRLQVRTSSASGESETTAPIATLGMAQPGDVKRYQLWYRDPEGSPCGSGFNLTNGYELTWEL